MFLFQFFSINSHNIVNLPYHYNLGGICVMAFKSENFEKAVNDYAAFKRKIPPCELQATLRGPICSFDLPVSIIAYTCKHSITEDINFTR